MAMAENFPCYDPFAHNEFVFLQIWCFLTTITFIPNLALSPYSDLSTPQTEISPVFDPIVSTHTDSANDTSSSPSSDKSSAPLLMLGQ